MRLLLKIALGILAVPVTCAAAGFAYVQVTWKKDLSAFERPKITASQDPEVIERGRYLVHVVAHCSGCHQPATSTDDVRANTLALTGNQVWDIPPFGRFVSANITPDATTGIGSTSDGDLARSIRYGIGRDGSQLAFMSFSLGPMADEDLTAIVSYLRTLQPLPGVRGVDEPAFIGKLVMKGVRPRTDAPPKWVPPGDASVERGQYLANGPAACGGCHTQSDPMQGFAFTGPKFAGNPEADPDATDPAFEIAAPNLTPDPETGHIRQWTEESFIGRFRAGRLLRGSHMPWENFQALTASDLTSLYRYLQSLAPVRKVIGPPRRPAGWKPEKS